VIVISGKNSLSFFFQKKFWWMTILIADSSGFLNLFKLYAMLAVVMYKCISSFMVIRVV